MFRFLENGKKERMKMRFERAPLHTDGSNNEIRKITNDN